MRSGTLRWYTSIMCIIIIIVIFVYNTLIRSCSRNQTACRVSGRPPTTDRRRSGVRIFYNDVIIKSYEHSVRRVRWRFAIIIISYYYIVAGVSDFIREQIVQTLFAAVVAVVVPFPPSSPTGRPTRFIRTVNALCDRNYIIATVRRVPSRRVPVSAVALIL